MRAFIASATFAVALAGTLGCGTTAPGAPTTLNVSDTAPIPIEIGATVHGATHQRVTACTFSDLDRFPMGVGSFCEAYEISVTDAGVLNVTVQSQIGHHVTLKTAAGAPIMHSCCGGSLQAPVESGLYRIEVTYPGTPEGYPHKTIPPFALSTAWKPNDGSVRQRLVARVFVGDESSPIGQLETATIEVVDGLRAGETVRFNATTNAYELNDVPIGNVTLRTSAEGFETVTSQVAVGVSAPGRIVTRSMAPLVDATNSLSGSVGDRDKPNFGYVNAKIEILDGPLAGVFTFVDEDMGFFSFTGLPAGVIHVRASSSGRSDTQEVTISGRTVVTFKLAAN